RRMHGFGHHPEPWPSLRRSSGFARRDKLGTLPHGASPAVPCLRHFGYWLQLAGVELRHHHSRSGRMDLADLSHPLRGTYAFSRRKLGQLHCARTLSPVAGNLVSHCTIDGVWAGRSRRGPAFGLAASRNAAKVLGRLVSYVFSSHGTTGHVSK